MTSGHWEKYREHMFAFESEDRDFGLKPMNCPGHCDALRRPPYSYRELPLRMAEAGVLHRNELSGALHGLLRVRLFSQDDAHIFCAPEQIEAEVLGCLDFGYAIYHGSGSRSGSSCRPGPRTSSAPTRSGTRPRGRSRRRSSDGVEYVVNEGDGAFYGPKIDLHMLDSLGRTWQIGTVQLDFQMPQRFGLGYQGADNAEHTPVMIHRALIGSFERFIGILIEHFGGAFPFWLAPVQVRILPVGVGHHEAAGGLAERLAGSGWRWTSRTRRSASGSGTPRSRRSRSRSSTATGSPTRRSPSASTAAGSRRSRSPISARNACYPCGLKSRGGTVSHLPGPPLPRRFVPNGRTTVLAAACGHISLWGFCCFKPQETQGAW